MSIWAIGFPAEAAISVVETLALMLARFSRPLLGWGALAGVMLLFKPLLIGLLQAALLVIQPRRSLSQRSARERLRDALLLARLVNHFETSHPSQAAELRLLAARD